MTPEEFLAEITVNLDQNRILLDSPAFRESLYRHIHPKAEPDQLLLMRVLFSLECHYRSQDEDQDDDDFDYFENIYWCALFLYQIGDVTDSLPIWRAKHINMDTGCGFDAQFLVGAGLEETCTYLEQSEDPDAVLALEYIRTNLNSGTFSDLDDWYEAHVQYYASPSED